MISTKDIMLNSSAEQWHQLTLDMLLNVARSFHDLAAEHGTDYLKAPRRLVVEWSVVE
jgi:hypothetical protein